MQGFIVIGVIIGIGYLAARYNAGTTFARDGVLLSTICSPVCILAIALLLS